MSVVHRDRRGRRSGIAKLARHLGLEREELGGAVKDAGASSPTCGMYPHRRHPADLFTEVSRGVDKSL